MWRTSLLRREQRRDVPNIGRTVRGSSDGNVTLGAGGTAVTSDGGPGGPTGCSGSAYACIGTFEIWFKVAAPPTQAINLISDTLAAVPYDQYVPAARSSLEHVDDLDDRCSLTASGARPRSRAHRI